MSILLAAGALGVSSEPVASEVFERPSVLRGSGALTLPFLAFTLGQPTLCRSSAVRLTPNGDYLIFSSKSHWRGSFAENSTSLGILSLQCYRSSRALSGCGSTFSSPEGLHVVAQGTDGSSLFLLVGGSELLQVSLKNPSSPLVLSESLIPPAVGRLQAKTWRTSSSTANEEAARIKARGYLLRWEKRGYSVRAITAHDSKNVAIIENQTTLRLSVADRRKILLNSPFYGPSSHDASIVSIFGSPALAISGDLASVRPLSRPPLPHQIAVADAATGKLLGVRNDLGQWADLRGRQDGRRQLFTPDAGAQTLDAASTRDGAVSAALFQATNGTRSARITIGKWSNHFDCEADSAAIPANIERHILGERRWPIVLTIASPPHSIGTAVIFPGGPGEGIDQIFEHSSARHFLAAGYRIVAVDYSGSGLDGRRISNRLVPDPLTALARDAEVLANNWTRLTLGRDTIIAGESFGAIPAALLANRIPGTRLVLIAPFLRHRDPSVWLSNPIAEAYQRTFEATALNLGSPILANAFQRRLDETFGALDPKMTLVVSGTRDKISPPEDLASVSTGRAASAKVFASHEFITGSDDTWAAVTSWLANKSFPNSSTRGTDVR